MNIEPVFDNIDSGEYTIKDLVNYPHLKEGASRRVMLKNNNNKLMQKEKEITPLSKFPTEVLVFYFKKFRKCRHYEYEKLIYDADGYLIDDPFIIEDVTTEPFTTKCDWRDDEMYIKFEGLYWHGKCHEFMDELNKRGNVNISSNNFKDWKREYKKTHANGTKRKEKTVLRK